MSPVLAALSQSKLSCHPEAAEPLARELLPTKDLCASCRRRVSRITWVRFVEGHGFTCRHRLRSDAGRAGNRRFRNFRLNDEQTAPAFAKGWKGWAILPRDHSENR
jgi:hypothetical protein